MAKKSNVEKFNSGLKINVGLVIFAVIFIYIVICLVINSKKEKITGFQVRNGSLSENRIYTGIALRKENVVNSDYSGYINFFIREGERASYNNLVYCIDESGKFSDLYGSDPTQDNSLSSSDLTSLRQDIQLFSKNFSVSEFGAANSFVSRISNELAQIENRKIIDDISTLTGTHSNDIVEYIRAKKPGIVLYYVDGYEEALASDISAEDFDMENYEAKKLVNDDLVEAGSFAYKYVTDENWSIVIKVPKDEALKFTDGDYVEVKFSKTLNTSYGRIRFVSSDGDFSYFELTFTNSMITFCKDRFVEIELLLDKDSGLKIPNSSIAEKSFYLIDKAYVMQGGNSSSYGVSRREFNESGEIIKFIEIKIMKEEDDYYYVDTSSLNYGDVLMLADTAVESVYDKTFVVGKQGTLIGVYSINKGYAEFKRIEILFSNDEYSIVRPNLSNGLRNYDYIALDGSVVFESDMAY